MPLGKELAELFERDLARLKQEIDAFADDAPLWKTAPGVSNSAGNLVLHLEGNLRHYIGFRLGGVAYARSREREFSPSAMTRDELGLRAELLGVMIPGILSRLTDAVLARQFPEIVYSRPLPTSQVLISLHAHFNYHLGQIDYLRRVLTQSGAVDFVQI